MFRRHEKANIHISMCAYCIQRPCRLRFPQPGWDEARMSDKFRWLAEFVMDKPRIEPLLRVLWQFEQVPDVSQFVRDLV